MHERNPYKSPPDFAALARVYSPLQKHLVRTANGGSTVDFHDKTAQRRLTEALLHRDFGVTLNLPEDRLCPPIPNRLNYVLWIQDIIRATSTEVEVSVRGVDVGTGSSVIYPILACKLQPNWSFIAIDIDPSSLSTARANVETNELQNRIAVMSNTADAPILLPLAESPSRFDFTMCNPPFYANASEVASSAEAKTLGPNAVCTGADVEMITPGGESAFVARMVQESLVLRQKCRWYTSMLGKMSSLTDIVELLRKNKIDNYAVTEFIQGQTRRWAIAWSFEDFRLSDKIGRILNPTLQSLMPQHTTISQHLPREHSNATQLLHDTLSAIAGVTISLSPSETDSTISISAQGNTWSRAARRKGAPVDVQSMRCTVRLKDECRRLEFQWTQGKDVRLFEGFCSHVGKKMSSAMEL